MQKTPLGGGSSIEGERGVKLSKAVEGFLLCKRAEGVREGTLEGYRHHLRLLIGFLEDREVEAVTTQDIRSFLLWLRTDYRPRRFGGREAPLSPKTLRNVWITLSGFWTWAEQDLGIPHVVRPVKPPDAPEPDIIPFSRDQVSRLLEACEASSPREDGIRYRRPTAARDKAIVMMLLDTGMRAGELCGLDIGDVDLETGQVRIRVRRGRPGPKGGRERHVYLGMSARRALWLYLAQREDGETPSAPLFRTRTGRRFRPDILRQLIAKLGERAGVKDCHPHRFRHTFAINYLRNGGDIFTLQRILGHSSLKMVKRYLHLAQVDIEEAHRRASPVDRWGL